jgi:hypothetical protein
VVDKGNGTYTVTFTAPYVTVATALTLSASASKTSYTNGAAQAQLTIQPKTLAVVTTANPISIYSGGTSTIMASLTSEGTAVTGATVILASSSGGTFSAITDQGKGVFVANFTAPDTVTETVCTITASASKSGYLGDSGETQVTVQTLILKIYVKASDGSSLDGVAVVSTSQPSGQTALSGSTDTNGKASFSNVKKGTYTFKATKSGYDDKTWTLTILPGQVTTETITLPKSSGGGIPGYPTLSVILALLASTIILYKGKHMLSIRS